MANVPNTQIAITSNGRTTLATAGKYCDRNIDIDVSVLVPPSEGGQPTQFTNLYDVANVTVNYRIDVSSSGATYTSDSNANYIKIPYHHIAGDPVVLRLRGVGTVRDRYGMATFAEDGATTVKNYSLASSSTSYFTMGYDEHGDRTITFKGNLLTTEWYYFVFNFQYPGVNKSATAVTGPIITINEPIGNGGYVG